MKRIFAIMIVAILFITPFSLSVQAKETNSEPVILSVEYLENGDYIVTEMQIIPSFSLFAISSSTSGNKVATYYNASGSRVWDVTVYGTFTYTYGVSATATSATATVNIYNNKANFVSKSAYTSGNTATATGTVTYNSLSTTKSVSVSCDKYGNLY